MDKQHTKFKETELGLIPEDWQVQALKDLIDIIGGAAFKGEEFSTSGIPVIKIGNVKPGKITLDDLSYVAETTASKNSSARIKKGDLIITMTGNRFGGGPDSWVGKIARFNHDGDYLLNQRLAILKCKAEVDSGYLLYYLGTFSMQEHLALIASGGGGQANLSPNLLGSIKIPLPPLLEQQKIAGVLGALDEKIELNRKMNNTLEQIAQAIFKKWFIDDADPNWETKKLGELSDITIGRTPPRKEEQWFSTNPADVKWVSIKDMRNCGIFINKTSEYLTEEAVLRFNVPIIPANTLILSFKLTIGRLAITAENMVSNEAIAHLRLKNDLVSNEYLFYFLRNFDYSILGSTSSIATAVNSQTIKGIDILVPPRSKLEMFDDAVVPLHRRIQQSEQEIETLSQIRDSLLPRLMSGKLRVK